METPTRRNFLKTAAVSAAAGLGESLSAQPLPPPARPQNESAHSGAPSPHPGGAIAWRITDPGRRYALAGPLAWQPAAAPAPSAPSSPQNEIFIYPQWRQQEILGFGAAMTDAACYNLARMPRAGREALLHAFFSPRELNFSVCRTCVGSSDYSRTLYSFDEGAPDPELRRFSIAHDKAYILPMLRRARALNPELFLFSSPWSPPNWMKDNNSMKGGTIRRHLLPVYAQYMVKFLQAYRAAGVEINAISCQNEVDTDQDGHMPACLFPQEVEVGYVGQNLGPALRHAGLKTAIWLIDHNYNLWGRAICELDDPDVRRFANAIAWHGYVGKPEWMQKVAAAHPGVEMYWTEGGPDYTAPDYATDWAKWSDTFTGILRNGPRCIIAWNLVLDERGRPNIGPFSCGGVATVNSISKKVSYSGQFWAFNHYSRSIRRGARIVGSEGGEPGVSHVAAINPDGGYLLVLTNSTSSPRAVSIRHGDAAAALSLPADSVSTLTWTS